MLGLIPERAGLEIFRAAFEFRNGTVIIAVQNEHPRTHGPCLFLALGRQ